MYKDMNKGEMVKYLQSVGLMADIKEFDYALPQQYLNAITEYVKANRYNNPILAYREDSTWNADCDIYSHITSRFVYAYYHDGTSGLFCVVPDYIGQSIIAIIGSMDK